MVKVIDSFKVKLPGVKGKLLVSLQSRLDNNGVEEFRVVRSYSGCPDFGPWESGENQIDSFMDTWIRFNKKAA